MPVIKFIRLWLTKAFKRRRPRWRARFAALPAAVTPAVTTLPIAALHVRAAARMTAALLVMAVLFAPDAPVLQARGLPTYAEVSKQMPELWRARYPVEVKKFKPNPDGRGVLRAVDQGRYVYYYHFQATVLRPVRGGNDDSSGANGAATDGTVADGTVADDSGADDSGAGDSGAGDEEHAMGGIAPRTVEFWARYRSWLAEPWDLSFVRQDRLPGSNRQWIQVR